MLLDGIYKCPYKVYNVSTLILQEYVTETEHKYVLPQ
jgi:hypothetical protein